MLLHFKKSNEILETWSPHCKNLACEDPPSLNFHNRTDANADGCADGLVTSGPACSRKLKMGLKVPQVPQDLAQPRPWGVAGLVSRWMAPLTVL